MARPNFMDGVFLQSAEALLRSFILLTGAYVSLIIFLRTSGKRTLSKMNAFDLVVTVALGSTLATISLSKDVALVQGLLVLGLLIVLQYVVAWLSVRSKTVRQIVKSEPALLFHRGAFLDAALIRERVTREEVLAALRAQGCADSKQARAVVLETDGSFSIVKEEEGVGSSALENVRGFERVGQKQERSGAEAS
jgi:uncharacterized membrane protein YcaP (DUF421 family)